MVTRCVPRAVAIALAAALAVSCASDVEDPAAEDARVEDPADAAADDVEAPDVDPAASGDGDASAVAVTLAAPGSITVPDGFPAEMPLPAEAVSSVTEDASVIGVTLNHPGESAALIAFYEEQLPAHGWSFTDSPVAVDNPQITENMRWWDVDGHGMTGSIVISDELAGPTMRVVMIMIDQ